MNGDIFTSRAPEVGYAERGVSPPSALYIGPNETLVVDTWSSTAPADLAVVARVLTTDGQIHTSQWSHRPNTNRTRATTYHRLPEGFLLCVTVDATGAAYRRGHCWCQVGIQVGEGATGVAHAQLISDYVTGMARLAWPGGQLRSSVEGRGLLRSYTGTDPAAGLEISVTVPTGARWFLLSFRADLTTDATVANRQPRWLVDDGAIEYFRAGTYASQPASQLWRYTWSTSNWGEASNRDPYFVPLPADFHLAAGHRIQTSTANLQAGDNWTAPQLFVEEWIEP